MATEVVSSVRTGGDYTSLSAWEAGEQRNLVTADEIAIAEIRGSMDAAYSSGGLEINGWTQDSTHFCEIRAEAGYEYDFVNDTGAKITGSGTFALVFRDGHYLHLTNLAVALTTGTPWHLDGSGLLIDRCCVFISGSNGCMWESDAATQFDVIGSLFICSSTSNNARITNQNLTGTAKNVTFIQTASGKSWGINFQNMTVTNCCSYRPTGTYNFEQIRDSTGDYNAQNNSGSAPPGSNSLTTLTTSDFVDFANGDYHTAANSVLIEAGTNLYSDFTTDLDGDTWPSVGAWDIGFDYYVSASATVTLSSPTATATGSTTATVGCTVTYT